MMPWSLAIIFYLFVLGHRLAFAMKFIYPLLLVLAHCHLSVCLSFIIKKTKERSLLGGNMISLRLCFTIKLVTFFLFLLLIFTKWMGWCNFIFIFLLTILDIFRINLTFFFYAFVNPCEKIWRKFIHVNFNTVFTLC